MQRHPPVGIAQPTGFSNVITYSAAISACEKATQAQKALELLEEMRQKGLEPDVITYNAAISACEKATQAEKALELLEKGSRKAWSHM